MDITVKLLPTLLLITLGYALKNLKLFTPDFGKTLLKFTLFVTAPALALRSLSTVDLNTSLIIFLVMPVVLTAISFVAVRLLQKSLPVRPKEFAVIMMSSMAINSAFALPFVTSVAGDEGAARVALFNVTNAIMIYGWVYGIAVTYGDRAGLSRLKVLQIALLRPSFAAIVLGLALNFNDATIPREIMPLIDALASMTVPVILIALGLILRPKILLPTQTARSLAIRMGGGLLIGLAIVGMFGLNGIDRVCMLLLATAPVGFNTITFAHLEGLDDELAASIVSVGLVAGIVLSSILIALYG